MIGKRWGGLGDRGIRRLGDRKNKGLEELE